MDTNYFVCTLGQAAGLRRGEHGSSNINDFIDRQAERAAQKPAVAFSRPPTHGQPQWGHHVFSFSDVRQGSIIVADLLLRNLGDDLSKRQTVALLCPSSPDFLFAWLALIRLGHAVLLIAPQCQPSAIAHLCKICGVSTLLYDDVYQAQARRSAQEPSEGSKESLRVFPLSLCIGQDIYRVVHQQFILRRGILNPAVDETSIAYLHHTSGTSSGLPKPIPQSHRAAVGVLPFLLEGSRKATFTTTPLYHGGIADLFRAWTSDALIWLFPGKEIPITASNIVSCLRVAKACSDCGEMPPVEYFSSVPYVLQMMEASEEALHYLSSMDIVGVGGAALPAEVGNHLVEKSVNLISRFGSAECGFLMSSHRDYGKDKEWQYLRGTFGAEALRFEEQGDGTFELVIRPGWPHMAKTNRKDGSYATADLFVPHPSFTNTWKYNSRADSQLALITGKKFDPAPLESAIATSPFLDDVLIFGNGKPFPGALLFRTQEFAQSSDQEVIEAVQPFIEKLNSQSQGHARIPRNMLIPMPHDPSALEKSSKGTVMRRKVEERYAKQIENAYSKLDTTKGTNIPDRDLQRFITSLVEVVVSKPQSLSVGTELFSYGVDSVACMQIRYGLKQLLSENSPELPLSIVEDCGTIKRLSEYIVKQRHGEAYDDGEDEHRLMLDLVEKYNAFDENMNGQPVVNGAGSCSQSNEVVVLTGATGALGSHILDIYRNSATISKIYCLVRGADKQVAYERVNKALKGKGLTGLVPGRSENDKIIVLQSQLGEGRLGLSSEMYEDIAREATIIMHIAWSVNFRMRLRSFAEDSIAGVQNLINLSLHSTQRSPPRFLYCSSVASVINHTARHPIPECVIEIPAAASSLGYSRSKWVAEQICYRAHQHTRLRSRIAVLRVGQLAGDTQRGIWNRQEAWPMMLGTAHLTSCLPALPNEPLNWLPVDVAAQAFVQTATNMGNEEARVGSTQKGIKSEMQVYHVLNEHQMPVWMQLLAWLKKMEDFDIVNPQEWIERLEKSRDSNGGNEHPALRLLGHWKKAYGETATPELEVKMSEQPVFAMEESKKMAPVLSAVRPVDEEYFRKIWFWLRGAKMNY